MIRGPYMNKLKFLALALVLFLGGCSAAPQSNIAGISGSDYQSGTASSESARSGGTANPSAPKAAATDGSLDQADKSRQQPTERKIIRNADLTIETASPEEAQKKIAAITEGKGGFVVESTQSSSSAQATTRDRVTMTLRVPAEKFTETLDEIKQAGGRVLVETVKGQDVTEEFIDVEARLKTKRELEARFLEILKQANTVAETLNVQTELARVRGEIEQVEGRKRFLESQTSLSTIKLTLQTPTAFSANSSGFVYQLGQALSTGFEAALTFILGFITFIIAIIPFLLLIVLPVYLLMRHFWRKYIKRRMANKLAQDEKAAAEANVEVTE